MFYYISEIQLRAVRLWLWFKGQVHNRTAEPWLAALSCAESFLIPIPVDPFLVAMVVADRARWAWLATVATTASLGGALVGYAIGFFAFDYLGTWLAGIVDKSQFIERMTVLFYDNALLLTFAAALTPIPNAPVVIAAGFVSTNVFLFIIAWSLARSIRFFGVAYVVYAFGMDTLTRTERVINVVTVCIALGVLGWVTYIAVGI